MVRRFIEYENGRVLEQKLADGHPCFLTSTEGKHLSVEKLVVSVETKKVVPTRFKELTKAFGKGQFIYLAPMQPLMGFNSFAPTMYSYVIFRKAIELAFESAKMPVPKLSPWPYAYNAAFVVRRDLENFTNEIAAVAASAAATDAMV